MFVRSTTFTAMKHLSLRLLTLCLAVAVSAHVAAGDKLFTAVYSSEYSGMDIEIVRTLESRGNGLYAYTFDADSAIARIKEDSIFSLDGGQFVPVSYTYERKVFGFGGKESIQFDWDRDTASYSKGKKRQHVHALKEGTLDSSLYQLQLQKDLFHSQPMQSETNTPKTSYTYTYVQRDKMKRRSFVVTGKTTYTVGEKTYPAIALQRVNENNDKSTEIIVIPELYYLIAQIQQEKDDTTYQTRLTEVSLNAEKLAKLYQ